jgi:hypothetical protein
MIVELNESELNTVGARIEDLLETMMGMDSYGRISEEHDSLLRHAFTMDIFRLLGVPQFQIGTSVRDRVTLTPTQGDQT